MATYKGIQGYTVQKLATDPTAAEAVGQLWYNSTTGAFKIGTQGAGAWAAGGALNTARQQDGGAGASNSNALCFGGQATTSQMAFNETYNGTTWTEINNLNAARRLIDGIGTTNTCLLYTSPSPRD